MTVEIFEVMPRAEIEAQLAEIAYFVSNYGAKGDGVTDDTIAIQNAINAAKNGGKVLFSNKKYLITSPLNLTNLASGGITLEGVLFAEDGYSTEIIGQTGGAIIDTTGSQYITIKNMMLKGGPNNTSTIGILEARSTTSGSAQFHNIENVYITLNPNTSANGGLGSIGIYNYAAELWRGRNLYILADRPMVFCNTHYGGIQSSYTTIINSASSMSVCTLDGDSTLTAFNNAALTLIGCYNFDFPNIYLNAYNNTYPYAIYCTGGNYQVKIFAHVESFGQLLQVDSSIMEGLDLRCTFFSNGQPAVSINANNANVSLIGSNIDCFNENSTAHTLLYGAGTSPYGINQLQNNIIQLHTGQSINAAGGYATGNIIKSEDPNPSISLSASPGYYANIIMTRNGLTLSGPTKFTDIPNFGGTTATTIGAAGTAAALPSAPVGYVEIQIAGTTYKVPYYNV